MRLTIGRLAREAGSNVETVRYYERIGLLPEPPRSEGGHRLYGGEHVRRFSFIRRSRELGFTLDDIRGLLAICDGGDIECEAVRAKTIAHRASVRRKIAELQRLDGILSEIAARCADGPGPDCPILDMLFGDGDPCEVPPPA